MALKLFSDRRLSPPTTLQHGFAVENSDHSSAQHVFQSVFRHGSGGPGSGVSLSVHLYVGLGPSSSRELYLTRAPRAPLTYSGGRRGSSRPPARAERCCPLAEAHHEASPAQSSPGARRPRLSDSVTLATLASRLHCLRGPWLSFHCLRDILLVGGQAATPQLPRVAASRVASVPSSGFFPGDLRLPSWLDVELPILQSEHERRMMSMQMMTNSISDAMERYKELIQANSSYRIRHSQLLREQAQLKNKIQILLNEKRELLVEQTELPASSVEAKRFCEETGMNICVPSAKQ
ncbi:uncharacterized protein Spetex2dl1 [Rattus norvegicus]|uniref:uncharacterized protein Spetex2dl1 n=1 Tax=Rattus norvegicus TaxID=10116 RepID=UPI002FD80956